MQEHRAYDALYDTTYAVSGPRDHYREQSRAAGFMLERCPEFNNMFSEVPTYPSQTFRFKAGDKVPEVVSREFDYAAQTSDPRVLRMKSDPANVTGSARYKYFKRPMLPPGPPVAHLAPHPVAKGPAVPQPLPPGTKVTTSTQSMYRESEAQTVPYAPEYRIPEEPTAKQQALTATYCLPEGVPEVLTLQNMKYGDGLPPGLAEVEMLEKQRLKRAFEASLPPLHDLAQLPLRQRMMEEWENAEWAEREAEIKGLQDERLEVLQRAFAKRAVALEDRAQAKVESLKRNKLAEKQKVFAAIQQRRMNALRKLTKARGGVEAAKPDIIEQYAEYSSEIYAPATRHGQFPDSNTSNLALDPKPFEPVNYQEVLELEGSIPVKMTMAKTEKPQAKRPSNAAERAEASIARQLGHIDSLLAKSKAENTERGHGDCWPAPLEEEAAEVQRRRRMHGPERPETPVLEHDLEAVARRAAIVLVQRLVRGRAVQNNMFEGKQKRLELIRELQLEEDIATVAPPPVSEAERAADALIAPGLVEILKVLTLSDPRDQARAMKRAMENRKTDEMRELEKAATKIQAGFRGHRVRKAPPPPAAAARSLSGAALTVGGTAEEEAAAVRIQAMQRGKAARKRVEGLRAQGDDVRARILAQAEEGGAAATAAAEAEEIIGLPEAAFEELSSFTDEDQAKITKIQAAARGRAARKMAAEKKSAAEAEAARLADLPDLESFTEEDNARIVKIQSGMRGHLGRKKVKTLKEQQEESRKEAQAKLLASSSSVLRPLDDFSAEEQQQVLKIQSVARGRAARKATAQKKALKGLTDGMSEEDQQRVVKIQAAARGKMARKYVGEKKAAASSAAPAAVAAAGAAEEELPALEGFTDEDQAKITKIQAAARGKIDRKKVAEKKAAQAGAAEGEEAAPAAAAAEEELPALEGFTDEDQAKITKIQAAARGKIDRKKVAEKKAAQAGSAEGEAAPAEEAAAPAAAEEELPALEGFTDEDQAKITKIQAAARGKIDRKKVAEKKAAQAGAAEGEAAPAEGAGEAPAE